MTDKVVPFPTEEYIDKLAVDRLIEELGEMNRAGKIAHLMVVRFDKDGEVASTETGGLRLDQMSYGIACLQRHLWQWMGK